MKEVKMVMGRMGVSFLEEGRLPGLLYADDLALYCESEQDLKVIVEHLVRYLGEEV